MKSSAPVYTIRMEDFEDDDDLPTLTGTLNELNILLDAYCVVHEQDQRIEVIWDPGLPDGPFYSWWTIITVEQGKG